MLGKWTSHATYQKTMVESVHGLFKRNPNTIQHYETAFFKMYHLNLDVAHDDFLPLFSPIGRPSEQQPEIFRSFVLMSHFRYPSLEEWIRYAKATEMVCYLVGVTPDTFPGESTHRDFYGRLWQAEDTDKVCTVHKKPKDKHGKKKAPPKHPNIVHKLCEKALSGEVFKQIPERLFQAVFTKVAVKPSAELGLLGDTNKLIVSGDGTCIVSHASSYGHSICKCNCTSKETCTCKRKFQDPDAVWGWDSSKEHHYYGYTAYLLSIHNPKLKVDLPIYMKLAPANRHDSVLLVTSLAHARSMYKGFLTFDSLLADSAHDNYATYRLLHEWDIKPFIALNPRFSDASQSLTIPVTEHGVPICADGHLMKDWGYEKAKHRRKYRCPFVAGSVTACPYAEDGSCKKSEYGKIVYIRALENLRLTTPVARGSEQWLEIYKQRSGVERVNNRILTDYGLEQPKRYGKKKIAFHAFLNAINVHLDAQVRVMQYKVSVLCA